jgi:hypothetical protein
MATTTMTAGAAATAQAAATNQPGLPIRVLALMPLWLLVVVFAGSPFTFQIMFAARPDIYGAPWGVVVEAAAMLWMVVGVFAIWNARSKLVESLGLLMFTIPATVVVVFTPAVILALQNQ